MIRRVLKFLGSLRFTLFLILSLSVVFLLGLWIPQKGLLKRDLYLQWKAGSPALVSFLESLGFTDIHTSPITLALWALFFLNLSLVMFQRVSVIKNQMAFGGHRLADPATTTSYPHKASVRLSADHQKILSEERYRLYGNPERFYAVKNRYSPIATLLFHLSFFLILLGGVISVYTRFAATVDLAEGETFTAAVEQYNPVPRMPKMGYSPEARFVVENIRPMVEQNTPVGLSVTVRDEQGRRHSAEINRPYKTDNTSFVIQNLGVAPLLIIKDNHGRELDGAYVKLNVLKGRQDVFVMAGLEFTVDFYPDYHILNGREGTRSEEVRNPALRFNIQKGRQFIAKRTVLQGQTIAFSDYRLSFTEMPYWVRFYVIKERGLGIVYTGFGIAIIALIWRLFFYRREIIGSVRVENGAPVLYLAGRAEFYKALFEDKFERLKQRLAGGKV